MSKQRTPKPFKSAPAVPETGRLKSICLGTSEVFKLDPRWLTREPGLNTRYDFGDISVLTEDILVNGIQNPLKVRKVGKHIHVIDGDRRLTSVEKLLREGRWPEDPSNPGHPLPVPCTSEGKQISPADRIFMMLSLNTGKPFTLLEKGLAYQNLLATDESINQSEIARRTGETKQAVSNALQIVNHASPELITLIKKQRISATTALEIIKSTNSHEEQNTAANQAVESASSHGRSHATPKDLPAKPSPQPTNPEEAPPFIADLSDSDPSDSDSDPDPDESTPPNPDAPADPSSYDRLKSAPSSNRDGSSGGPGQGYADADARLRKVEELLDELNRDACHEQRWETIELVLDYLNGNHTIATIRKHLAL